MIESTIIQNGPLYLVQHKVQRLRRRFFGGLAGRQLRKIQNFARGIMNRSRLATLQNEENAARNRWEGEGGNSGQLQVLTASNQEELVIPFLVSTEEAIRWGSHLNAKQYTTLVETQRALSKDALSECNMQRMVDLATQSQLLREAAEAFIPRENDAT
jgi:hypothetical protein